MSFKVLFNAFTIQSEVLHIFLTKKLIRTFYFSEKKRKVCKKKSINNKKIMKYNKETYPHILFRRTWIQKALTIKWQKNAFLVERIQIQNTKRTVKS